MNNEDNKTLNNADSEDMKQGSDELEKIAEELSAQNKPAGEKKLKNIFDELDNEDADLFNEHKPPEISADEVLDIFTEQPQEEPEATEASAVMIEPEDNNVDEAKQRRQMIEHTRNINLSSAEIAARKKAHAERHSNGKKKNGKKKSQSSGAVKSSPAPKSEQHNETKSDSAKKSKPNKKPQEEKALDMEDFRRARNKIKSRKRIKRLIILLVIVVFGAGIFFTRNLWIPKLEGILEKPRETIVNDSTEQAGNFPLDTGDSTVKQIVRLDGSIITVDNSHLSTYDTNGKLRESIYHGCGSPEVRTSGKKMLCFDFGGTGFKLYNKSGVLFEKQLSNTILLGDIASNGNVMIVSEDSKYIVTINVYDKSGEDLYHWTNGDRVSNACFTNDGNGIIVTTFSASEGKLNSVVHKIDITQSSSVFDSDPIEGMVIKTCETSEGNIWALSENMLRLLSTKCQPLDTYEFNNSAASFDLSQNCACIASDNISGGTSVFVFGGDSYSLKPKVIEGDGKITRVRCYDDMAFVLSNSQLNAYAPDGKLVSTAAVSNDHIDFVYSENAAYFIDRQEISKLVFKT